MHGITSQLMILMIIVLVLATNKRIVKRVVEQDECLWVSTDDTDHYSTSMCHSMKRNTHVLLVAS